MAKKEPADRRPSPPPKGRCYSVDDILRLIRESKAAGVAFFEGPDGIRFGFKRETPPRSSGGKVTDSDEGWLP